MELVINIFLPIDWTVESAFAKMAHRIPTTKHQEVMKLILRA